MSTAADGARGRSVLVGGGSGAGERLHRDRCGSQAEGCRDEASGPPHDVPVVAGVDVVLAVGADALELSVAVVGEGVGLAQPLVD